MTPRSSPALLVLAALLLGLAAGAFSKLQVQHSAVTRVRVVQSNYHWTISNYTLYQMKPGQYFESPVISTYSEDVKLNWSVLLYPHGESNNGSQAENDDFGVYLVYAGGDLDSIPLSYTIHLLDADGDDYKVMDNDHVVRRGIGVGDRRLASAGEIVDPANGVLDDDELRIFVEFSAFIGDRTYSNDCRQRDGPEPEGSAHLESYLGSFDYSDLTISAANVDFRAHRVLLASRSRVFDEVFKNFGTGRNVLKFTMDDFSAEVVAEALRYIYTGKIGRLSEDQAVEMLTLAHKYDIAGMEDLVREELCLALDLDPEERAKIMDEMEYEAIEIARRTPVDAQKVCSTVPIDLAKTYGIE